jgi:hypothetical protein
MKGQTKLLGNELLESNLWDDMISVASRWLFICLLLKTDDEGWIVVDEDYRVCSEISGLGIQSAQKALAELQKANLICVFEDDTICINRVSRFRHRQTVAQAKAAERVRRHRERKAQSATSIASDNDTENATSNPPPQTPPSEISSSTSTSTDSTSSTSSTSTVQEEEEVRQAREQKWAETGFTEFWNAYGKKTGAKPAFSSWNRMTKKDRRAAMGRVPDYVASTPDVRYRKNPSTWLNQRGWEDEMVAPQKPMPQEHLHEAGEIDF